MEGTLAMLSEEKLVNRVRKTTDPRQRMESMGKLQEEQFSRRKYAESLQTIQQEPPCTQTQGRSQREKAPRRRDTF